MFRHTFSALFVLALLAGSSNGQEWARKMFDKTSHDFGNVARGAKVEHRIKITNIYEEDLRIAGVRSSCGCTSPSLTKQELKTWETAELVAKFNTNMQGYKSATVTVTIDKPFPAEVQLQFSGNIRTDTVISPGAVDFGSVDAGSPAEQKIIVTHVGRGWEVTDVRSANEHFEVEYQNVRRPNVDVAYEFTVRLKPDAPAGYIKEQLMLVTNNRQVPHFFVDVEGRVAPALTVSPASLSLGALEKGQSASKNLVVRGRRPFKIVDIQCNDEQFQFRVSGSANREVHLIPVTFTAGNAPGRISERIRIVTDLGAEEVILHAEVTPGEEIAGPSGDSSSATTPSDEVETLDTAALQ